MSKLVLLKLCKNTNKRSLEKKKKTHHHHHTNTPYNEKKNQPKPESPTAYRDWKAEVSALELFLWTDSKLLGEDIITEAKVHSN